MLKKISLWSMIPCIQVHICQCFRRRSKRRRRKQSRWVL